jgi:chorismate mutase
MTLRGVRGAIAVEADEAEIILAATQELLNALITSNPGLSAPDLASAVFTMTEDLSAAYPAQAARQMGWDLVAMMCVREIPVPGSLPRCIRILLHWNTDLPQEAIQHVYLGAAANLRPDLSTCDLQPK